MPLVRQDQLRAIFPKARQEMLDAFNDHWLGLAEINTVPRLRYLLAQVGHESLGLTVLEENLNYSWAGLYKTFPKYFTSEQARAYARQPERIANRVYANRMGNGPESSGDGWKYRGRGVIQLTGRANYQAVAKRFTEINCVDDPDVIKTPDGAMAALVTFWVENRCNAYADARDFVGLTKRINGGTNGLQDRYRWRAIVEAIL
jgi:putative chitinase